MQNLSLQQKQIQKLSPQQLQFIKLLQLPAIEIRSRIEEELANNPILELGPDVAENHDENNPLEEINISSLTQEDIIAAPRLYSYDARQAQAWRASKEAALPQRYSLQEQLLVQLSLLGLNEHQHKIGEYLIGSIEADGYIRRDLAAIVNDLAITQYLNTTPHEVLDVLLQIQTLDPPGIAARNLQECLLLQLNRQADRPVRNLAIKIVRDYFDIFIKKHIDQLFKKIGIDDTECFKAALAHIAKLNPKPGGGAISFQQNAVLYPDFMVNRVEDQIIVQLNNYNAPKLKISKSYLPILTTPHTVKNKQEASQFIKQKLASAQGFIEAIKQRQETLFKTMQTIVNLQHDFFLEEDEAKLKPMVLKDVAQLIGMDVSTVSRIVSKKYVQTEHKIYPLKYFFSEGIGVNDGEEVSNKAVQQLLHQFINQENKKRPYSDEKLTALLVKEGYHIARRTVAKYRELLQIPVARLRKEF